MGPVDAPPPSVFSNCFQDDSGDQCTSEVSVVKKHLLCTLSISHLEVFSSKTSPSLTKFSFLGFFVIPHPLEFLYYTTKFGPFYSVFYSNLRILHSLPRPWRILVILYL